MKYLKTYEQYTEKPAENLETINEAVTIKDVQSVKGNKDGIAKLFNRVFYSSLKMGAIKQKYEKELISDLNNVYKCLEDGANDNFKGGIRVNPQGNLQYTAVKFGSSPISSSAL